MKYSQEDRDRLVTLICDRISEGESLRSVLRSDNMPDKQSFFNWIDSSKEYFDQYARAKEARADAIFEDILEIADETQNDTITKVGKDGEIYEAENKEWINRSRLKIDSRKWMLSKMLPKKYGDKIDVTTDGEKITIINLGSGLNPDKNEAT